MDGSPLLQEIGAERRRHDRYDVQLPVTIRYQGRLIPATALNLSCGGMQLDAQSLLLDRDGKVELIFDLSTLERDVAMRAEVSWCEVLDSKSRVGVRFTNLFTVGHEAVTRYIGRNHKKSA